MNAILSGGKTPRFRQKYDDRHDYSLTHDKKVQTYFNFRF